MKVRVSALITLLGAAWLYGQPKAGGADTLLRAMQDELARCGLLRIVEPPYFVEYAVDDAEQHSASASLGALLHRNQTRFRLPRVQVRVGSYQLDNTNFLLAESYSGARYEVDRLPLEDSYWVLRRHFWLATDMAYKAALEGFSRKRAALRSLSTSDQLPDFYRAPPVQLLESAALPAVDAAAWTERVRRVSAVFVNYPKVIGSVVDYTASRDVFYLANSEGTQVREPSGVMFVRIRATSQAGDGMLLRDAVVLHTRDLRRAPNEGQLQQAAQEVARNLSELAEAPVCEPYTGPVLFEAEAAGQLFAQLLGRNLAAVRRPLMPPGKSLPIRTSELEGRIGVRILPEWMDAIDDPTAKEHNGRPLFGHYRVDLEGVPAQRVTVVEKGVLKSYLLTRQPIRGFQGSNGHARLPGGFGAKAAAISNLFVRSAEAVSLSELKKKLIELCRQRGKPYGMLVRKMDFPSSATWEEARRMLEGAGGGGGISPPVLLYRVHADGREELVRGMRFRNLNARSLRDILAASHELHVFDYLENGAPFALMGAAGYVAECSVVAPSVLIDDLELERAEEQFTRPPLVPPPPLAILNSRLVR